MSNVKVEGKKVSFDPIWEEKYSSGHNERYPWDCIVTFVFRHAPRNVPRKDVKVLEVGCGTGSNLWFAAREGFSVAGVDGSKAAIDFAKKRMEADGLSGDLQVADFTKLPFADSTFDLVIDRGALTCCGLSDCAKAVGEIHRVMKSGALFHVNPYSQKSTSFLGGTAGDDGLTVDIRSGTLTGTGQVCFYSRRELDNLLKDKFEILSVKHLQIEEEIDGNLGLHSEWRVIARKP